MRIGRAALFGIASGLGALVAREAWMRRKDARHIEEGRDFWRLAMPSELVRWVDAHRQSFRIPSGDVGIHLDVYAQPASDAPIVIIAHGIQSYGRLFAPLAYGYFQRGYAVVCVDLRGNGFSGGTRGDYTVLEATSNLVDASIWARQRFDGDLYLMGVSLGGALAYHAAAAGAPVSAVSCLDLFMFDDHDALRQIIATPRAVDFLPLLRLLTLPFGWVRVPTTWAHRRQAIVSDAEIEQMTIWLNDPLSPHELSLRAIVSAGYTPPAVPLEHNRIPTLVINQEDDTVLDPAVTKANFDRLGGEKHYVLLEKTAHWSFVPGFYTRLVEESDGWFQQHGMRARLSAPLHEEASR